MPVFARTLTPSRTVSLTWVSLVWCLTAWPVNAQARAPRGESVEPPPAASFRSRDVSRTIQSFIERDSELKGGFFLLYDDEAEQPLALKLAEIRSPVRPVDRDRVVACVEMRQGGEQQYDVDFVVGGKDRDHLRVVELTVHAVDGKARYHWYEMGGLWKKQRVEDVGKFEFTP